MKDLNTKSLQNSVILYISVAMLILLLSSVLTITYVQTQYQNNKEKDKLKDISSSIQYTINYILKTYHFRAQRIIDTTDINNYILKHDREGLYKLLYPKFKLMQEQNKYFKIMHIHLANGKSFLRLHKPDVYGDDIAKNRPILKEIHKEHKMIHRFEKGIFYDACRIINPIFDSNGKYIGALELGIDVRFIIDTINGINNFQGVLFVNQNKLTQYSKSDDAKLNKLLKEIKLSDLNKHKFKTANKEYLTHSVVLESLSDSNVKIVFFQAIDSNSSLFYNKAYFKYSFILLVFIVLVILVYRKIKSYQIEVKDIYNEQVQELKEQKYLFEQFMQNIPGAVTILNHDRKYVYTNSHAQEILAINNPELNHKKRLFEDIAFKSGEYEGIIEFKSPSGTKVYRVIEFTIKTYNNKEKLATLAFDITTEYNTKKELEHKEDIIIAQSRHAAMGEMISMIAHQWRQPISIISMDANNILVDIGLDSLDKETLLEYANNITLQTQELSKTINDFRDFFKPGKKPEQTSLRKIFDDALGIIKKSLENNGIKLIDNIDDKIILKTYSRELMQVFINLLNNSKEVLSENDIQNPQITVSAEDKGNDVYIEVCDNGTGVKDEYIDKIFEPYFTTKQQKTGTGLGLYMVETIIEKHLNGAIKAKNSSTGLCFNITISKNI